jgi:urease accessory protein
VTASDNPGPGLALLLLADGRFPAGGHAHSGGIEPAVSDGSVRDLPTLAEFLRGRLATAGLVAAAFAAAGVLAPDAAARLEAELDARTPSPAARAASRAQGRALIRVGAAAWPSVAARTPVRAPHHSVALGLVAVAAGLSPGQAALAAVHGILTGSATAATRLLGLDPLAVAGLLASLAGPAEAVAAEAVAGARAAADPADLPAASSVRLDLLAERHRAAGSRMFAS